MTKDVAIIGGGPAGLIAAEILAKAGCRITVYERKPSVGRKFLMAGRGGLNITHSEPLDKFLTRYGARQDRLSVAIRDFTPAQLRAWCDDLGEETFVGSSGRVFPKSLKASPLLRAWLERLDGLGVIIKRHYEWTGWNKAGELCFRTPSSIETVRPDATLLALGGASWPSLGSDGRWAAYLSEKNIPIAAFEPSNCGFVVGWSDYFRDKFSGQPLKSIALAFEGQSWNGEVMITAEGIEGGGIYARSSALREAIRRDGKALLSIDLRPSLSMTSVESKLSVPRDKQSLPSYLRKTLNLSPMEIALLHEAGMDLSSPQSLAALVKSLPLTLTAPFAIERAISSAGGIRFDAIDERFMLKNIPGVFVAGEMLDWEAPTGGYLLQATFATGRAAALGLLQWLGTD